MALKTCRLSGVATAKVVFSVQAIPAVHVFPTVPARTTTCARSTSADVSTTSNSANLENRRKAMREKVDAVEHEPLHGDLVRSLRDRLRALAGQRPSKGVSAD